MARAKKSSVGLGSKEESADNSALLLTGLSDADYHLPLFHYMALPKNTAITSYLSYTMILPISRIVRLWFQFPSGCAGLVGLQIWRATTQIFPLPAGQWFITEGDPISFAFTHFVDREPYEVEIRGYNVDDRYPHTPWVAIELQGLPSELTRTQQQFLKSLME